MGMIKFTSQYTCLQVVDFMFTQLYTCLQIVYKVFTNSFTCTQLRTHTAVVSCIHICIKCLQIRLHRDKVYMLFTVLHFYFFFQIAIEESINLI